MNGTTFPGQSKHIWHTSESAWGQIGLSNLRNRKVSGRSTHIMPNSAENAGYWRDHLHWACEFSSWDSVLEDSSSQGAANRRLLRQCGCYRFEIMITLPSPASLQGALGSPWLCCQGDPLLGITFPAELALSTAIPIRATLTVASPVPSLFTSSS